jgi:D-alanine-D-alanine ligase
VSRASGEGVARALLEAEHRVVRLELDTFVAESLRTGGYDAVFPVAHGAVGEDGSLQGLLEVLGVPYVGSGVLASALGMHKRIARIVFASSGLPVAPGLVFRRSDALAAAVRARREIGARLVVKPSSHGSAIGVARLDASASDREVARALEAVWSIDEYALVEHFAKGREVTCGVLATGNVPQALPPTEILSPRDPFYTYQARYEPGRSVHVCPAEMSSALAERIAAIAVQAHSTLGCRDFSRVDFVVGDDDDSDAITLLEVNTLPGMTATSLYPEAAAAAGIPMPTLCDSLVQAAYARGPSPRSSSRPLPR